MKFPKLTNGQYDRTKTVNYIAGKYEKEDNK